MANQSPSAAGLSPFAHRTYSDDDMINELRRVAQILQSDVLSGPKFVKYSRISRQAIMSRFGTWRKAISAAGLNTPTIAGGIHKACLMCGVMFRGDNGKKSSKTCSAQCASHLMYTQRVLGRESSKQAARGRAQYVRKMACETCGTAWSGPRSLHVHHRDRDPFNNAVENLVTLCVSCHWAIHRPPSTVSPCGWCGVMVEQRKRRKFCSRRCAGHATAEQRIARGVLRDRHTRGGGHTTTIDT